VQLGGWIEGLSKLKAVLRIDFNELQKLMDFFTLVILPFTLTYGNWYLATKSR
jgi:hypothetical protein